LTPWRSILSVSRSLAVLTSLGTDKYKWKVNVNPRQKLNGGANALGTTAPATRATRTPSVPGPEMIGPMAPPKPETFANPTQIRPLSLVFRPLNNRLSQRLRRWKRLTSSRGNFLGKLNLLSCKAELQAPRALVSSKPASVLTILSGAINQPKKI
jgi:hypothetical protein